MQVFAGIRKNSHGAGKIALPGGHLEMFESWQKCAVREVKEETDLDIINPELGHITNDPMESEGKHYVTIFMMAKVKGSTQIPPSRPKGLKRKSSADPGLRRSSRHRKGRTEANEELVLDEATLDDDELMDAEQWTPKNMEPEKCEAWRSYTFEELIALNVDNRIFGPLQRLLEDEPKSVRDFFNA
jgi:ADP-ribose pyrophosphatase YjhB (NUDIX family)